MKKLLSILAIALVSVVTFTACSDEEVKPATDGARDIITVRK